MDFSPAITNVYLVIVLAKLVKHQKHTALVAKIHKYFIKILVNLNALLINMLI